MQLEEVLKQFEQLPLVKHIKHGGLSINTIDPLSILIEKETISAASEHLGIGIGEL
jgi:hypothetical protein